MKLIDKDALVAEIDKLKDEALEYEDKSRWFLVAALKKRIESLGVKEVNLDFQTFAKEMDSVFSLPSSETKNTEEEPLNWEYAIAKHFFELGLKAQKGE